MKPMKRIKFLFPTSSLEHLLNQGNTIPGNTIPIPKKFIKLFINKYRSSSKLWFHSTDIIVWNQILCFCILVWGLCGFFHKIHECLFLLFIIGTVLLGCMIFLDMGGFTFRDWVERQQYERFRNAQVFEKINL